MLRIVTYLASIFPFRKYSRSRIISHSILAFCRCKLSMFSVESFGTRPINAFLNRYLKLFCCTADKFIKFWQGKRTCIDKLKTKYVKKKCVSCVDCSRNKLWKRGISFELEDFMTLLLQYMWMFHLKFSTPIQTNAFTSWNQRSTSDCIVFVLFIITYVFSLVEGRKILLSNISASPRLWVIDKGRNLSYSYT